MLSRACVSPEHFSSLADVLSPELIDKYLVHAGVATLRKRRLPLDMMVWSIVGMTLFRHIPVGKSLVSSILSYRPTSFRGTQRRCPSTSTPRVEAVKRVFEQTPYPHWCGLRLLGVDGVVWRTPDTPDNQSAFTRTRNAYREASYPQVRMVCQMELTSQLITGAAFDSISTGEVALMTDLIADHDVLHR